MKLIPAKHMTEPMDSWTHLPGVLFQWRTWNGRAQRYFKKMREIGITFVIAVILNAIFLTLSNLVYA